MQSTHSSGGIPSRSHTGSAGILQNVPVTGAYQSPGHTFVETQKNLCDGNAGLVLCRFGNDFSGGLVIPVLTLQDRRTLRKNYHCSWGGLRLQQNS